MNLPENISWLSPYIMVKDVSAAAEFYKKAFRFEVGELVKGEDGSYWHGELRYKKQLVMIGKAGVCDIKTMPPITNGVDSPISLYVYCEDVDEFYNAALAASAISVAAPEDMFWGDRMCKLKDPDGYIWAFATYHQKR